MVFVWTAGLWNQYQWHVASLQTNVVLSSYIWIVYMSNFESMTNLFLYFPTVVLQSKLFSAPEKNLTLYMSFGFDSKFIWQGTKIWLENNYKDADILVMWHICLCYGLFVWETNTNIFNDGWFSLNLEWEASLRHFIY